METMNMTTIHLSGDYVFTFDLPIRTIWTVLAFLVFIASFRIYCGTRASVSSKDGQPVPLTPYWLPVIGNTLQLVFQPNKLLHGMRANFPHGISSIVLAGSTHNMIWSPSLAQAVFFQRSSVVDFQTIIWYILVNIGGVPNKYKPHYEKAIPPLNNAIVKTLLQEPHLSQMVGTAVGNIEDNLPLLVTFCQGAIDQSSWERLADAKFLHEGESPVMEVSLLPLILNFTATCALSSIFGPDFHRNYPDILTDLWAFNDGFLMLAGGLPRWLPIPTLWRAYAARARLVSALTEFHEAMDAMVEGRNPGSKWGDIQEVSQLLKNRHVEYRTYEIPPNMRAPGDLAILWAMNANSNYLIFWMLLRIWSDPELTAQLRAEMAPFVDVEQPNGDFGPHVHELPRLRLHEKGLAADCPLLKSCYIETLRLHSAPWSLKKVLQDFTATESAADALKRGESKPQSYNIKAGTYADVPFDLHFTDPHYFPDPLKFVPDRHVVVHIEKGAKFPVAEFGTVRPYGGGRTMCKGRVFAEKECFAIVAGILALWDVEPADKEAGWKFPRHGKSPAVNMPTDDVRVHIRRRNITSAL